MANITKYILLLKLLIILSTGCSVKISKVSILTENQNVQATIYISNNYKNCEICTNQITAQKIEWAKSLCSLYDIESEIEIDDDTTELKVNLEINGFDKANALIGDLQNEINGLNIKFIQRGKTASVYVRIDPFYFSDNSEFMIRTDDRFESFSPTFNTNNLKLVEKTNKLIHYKIHKDTSSDGNHIENINYSYVTTMETSGNYVSQKKLKWSWRNFDTWERIGIILGIIVSAGTIFLGIKKIFYS